MPGDGYDAIAIHQETALLHAFLAGIADPAIVFDDSGRVFAVNHSAREFLGYRLDEEITGLCYALLIDIAPCRVDEVDVLPLQLSSHSVDCHQATARSCDCQHRACSLHHLSHDSESLARSKKGSLIPVEITVTEVHFASQDWSLCLIRSATKRGRQKAINNILHSIDSSVLHGGTIAEVFSSICRRLVELFCLPLVRITIREDNGSISVAAEAGEEIAFRNELSFRWDQGPDADRPMAKVMRTGQTHKLSPCRKEPTEDPASSTCHTHGIKGGLILPLKMNDRILGALSLYTRLPNFFDETTIEQFENLATRITIALYIALDQEKLHLQGVALSSAANAIVITDRLGRIEWVNEAFTRLSGYTREEAIGSTPKLINSGQHNAEFFSNMWNNILAGQVWRGEVLNVSKTGEPFVVNQTITPLKDSHGLISHFVAIHEDITERKRFEQELEKARDAALAAADAKSQFLANISHELRTPLNGILGMLSLLQRTALNSEQREHVETAIHSGDMLLTLLNTLLDFSKIEAGKLELEEIEFDLERALSEVVETVAAPAFNKNLELFLLVDPSVPKMIFGDPTRIKQILLNLLGNAVKFTDKGMVELFVSVMLDGTEPFPVLRMEVTDTGVGIPDNAHGRIFEIFSQADGSTTRKYGGSGLGLAICKQLVEQMGGEIGLRSQLGAGSTFWFTLPMHIKMPPLPPIHHLKPDHKVLRVLLVEDNPCTQKAMQRMLTLEGLLVLVPEYPGQSAAMLLKMDTPVDIVFISKNLQGPACEELLATLEQEPRWEKVAVIFIIPFGYHGSDPSRKIPTKKQKAVLKRPLGQFRIREALARILYGVPSSHPPREEESIPSQSFYHGQHILVVEDNDTNQKVTIGMLNYLGCQADVASNGLEAIEKIKQHKYDLILMDCHMPEMDGYAATRAIREREKALKRKKTPIVALTASTFRGSQECLAAGMDDYIAKPIRLERLLETLVDWLGLPSPHRTSGIHTLSLPIIHDDNIKTIPLASQAVPAQAVSKSIPVDQDAFAGLKQLMGDVFPELLESFIAVTRERIQDMEKALDRSDYQSLLYTSHTVKGSSSNVGAMRLSYLCHQLTEFCRSKIERSQEEIDPRLTLEEIIKEFQVVGEFFAEELYPKNIK